MTYIIGFSSGMFYIVDQGEKESFLTMPRKMFRGALEGVNFTQIDIESINEFKEPGLKDGIRRMKSIGLRFGFHGESYAMGGGEKPMGMLDSSIASDYAHSHDRLIQHINGCGDLGGEFVNIHPSETTPYIRLGKDLQPTRLVDPYGRSMREFFVDNKDILEWLIDVMSSEKPFIESAHIRRGATEYYHYYKQEEERKLNRILTEEESNAVEKKAWKKSINEQVDSNDLEYGAERISYLTIAKWMQERNDPLWKEIVGDKIPDKDLDSRNKDWVPAVSAKYIQGHFNPDPGTKYPDPKPLLAKARDGKGMYFVFETQMGSAGVEGLFRLQNPSDMVKLCKSIGSEWVGVCYDFEHVLSQNVNPSEDIEKMADGTAKYVKVCHLGWPTPHVPAHMPIPLGSEGQEYLYERLYQLRQKGMKDAFFIFERASAGRETTILALRMIKKYLEKDIDPKNLDLDFYGMEKDGPDIKRQQVVVNEHFFDPLKGMLQFPEEEYTFLSKAATDKGKSELWKKEQYR
jgi:hypothetical protein